jgi:hypothetical protein
MNVQGATRGLLRGKIDVRRGGDKLSWPDLATAPLGTDEEAAGAPAMHNEIAQARGTGHAFAAQPSWSNTCWFFVVVIVLIGASFVFALWISGK